MGRKEKSICEQSRMKKKILNKITNWEAKDFNGLFEYIREHWKYADSGYFESFTDAYELHTAGWSENEEIISALMKNYVFWMMYWVMSKRGGHFWFCKNEKSREKLLSTEECKNYFSEEKQE